MKFPTTAHKVPIHNWLYSFSSSMSDCDPMLADTGAVRDGSVSRREFRCFKSPAPLLQPPSSRGLLKARWRTNGKDRARIWKRVASGANGAGEGVGEEEWRVATVARVGAGASASSTTTSSSSGGRLGDPVLLVTPGPDSLSELESLLSDRGLLVLSVT
eukprot:2628219-Rhodomonas_salina.1